MRACAPKRCGRLLARYDPNRYLRRQWRLQRRRYRDRPLVSAQLDGRGRLAPHRKWISLSAGPRFGLRLDLPARERPWGPARAAERKIRLLALAVWEAWFPAAAQHYYHYLPGSALSLLGQLRRSRRRD